MSVPPRRNRTVAIASSCRKESVVGGGGESPVPMRLIKSSKHEPIAGQPPQGATSGRKSRRTRGTAEPVESPQIIRRPGQVLIAPRGSLAPATPAMGATAPIKFVAGFV